ncbi:MAG: radical SAM protein [Oligoflexia bacterium]|nr:radical SAM protein [Oligoflexia bacterium]
MKVLLVTAPMVQINCPYPATAYLKAYLNQFKELKIAQWDAGIALTRALFSEKTLTKLYEKVKKQNPMDGELAFFLEAYSDYTILVSKVFECLEGSTKYDEQIAKGELLPEGPSFAALRENAPLQEEFHSLSTRDKALHLSALFLDDLALYFKLGDDSQFSFSRYGEKLAASQASFSPIEKITKEKTIVSESLIDIFQIILEKEKPDLVGISIPFSGTLLGALHMGKHAKNQNKIVVFGGGYPNTELRSLNDPRFFDFCDYLCFDDGEMPLIRIIDSLQGKECNLVRTFTRKDNVVQKHLKSENIAFKDLVSPDYTGLNKNDYIPMLESLNPVERLWSSQFWNKLILAHGCYWRKCSFCDTSLDYIQRYEPDHPKAILEKMKMITSQTGCNGFHFVDEAAPPAILNALSDEIISSKMPFHWWGNIRFDKVFNQELTKKMAKAGCIAVTGGLEVANERILRLINKGVQLEQVAKVTKSFTDAGIFVHAYLMYGFPSQTLQETVDSLEIVRQLFQENCLQSAFWHEFSATAHSPIGKNPDQFQITLNPKDMTIEKNRFSQNDIRFYDKNGYNPKKVAAPLRAALYNYMHGVGIELDVREWFPKNCPGTTVAKGVIRSYL